MWGKMHSFVTHSQTSGCVLIKRQYVYSSVPTCGARCTPTSHILKLQRPSVCTQESHYRESWREACFCLSLSLSVSVTVSVSVSVSLCVASHHHIITSSHHHIITSSHHHIITATFTEDAYATYLCTKVD